MGLDKILMDDRLTMEQRDTMINLLKEVGGGFIAKVLSKDGPEQDQPQQEEENLPAGPKRVTGEDCDLCRFWATCVGAATFHAFLDLEALTFGGEGCPRDWEALKDLVQYSVLPNRQSPTL